MKLIWIIALLSLLVLTGCFENNTDSEIQTEVNNEITQEVIQDTVMEESSDDSQDNMGQQVIPEIDIMTQDSVIQEFIPVQAQAVSWSYQAYDSSLVGATDNTVIFFAATWCPSCVAADRNLVSAEIPNGITILKADYDSEIDLRREYGVTSQHTFVSVDAEGKQLRKWVGGTTIDDIIEKL